MMLHLKVKRVTNYSKCTTQHFFGKVIFYFQGTYKFLPSMQSRMQMQKGIEYNFIEKMQEPDMTVSL